MTIANDASDGVPGPIALNKWLAGVGVTLMTAWRWRKNGWLKTVNIAGRVYITREAIKDFTRRVEAGEFAKKPAACGSGQSATLQDLERVKGIEPSSQGQW